MRRWHLPSVEGSSDKRTERAAGASAPRVPSIGRQKPRVLFSAPECRAVVIDLRAGEALGDHRVRERALIHVISGRVSIEAADDTVECEAGTLLTFEPGERHAVRGLADARLLLVLAPWQTAAGNGTSPAKQHLPANATVDPLAPHPISVEASRGRRRRPSVDVARGVGAPVADRRVLLVMDGSVADTGIVRSAQATIELSPTEVYVVAPILATRLAWVTNDDADAVADAEKRLAEVLHHLAVGGVDAVGEISGDNEIVAAVGDALARFPADEILLAVHSGRAGHWRERDLATKIRHDQAIPLTELLVEHDVADEVRR